MNNTISQPLDKLVNKGLVDNKNFRTRMSYKTRFTLSDFGKNLTSKDSINKFKESNLYHC